MSESGGGLFDAAGMCDQLLRILNDVDVRGLKNVARIYSVANGLEVMRDSLRKGENDGQGTLPERQEP